MRVITTAKNLALKLMSPQQRFRLIYRTNRWGSPESVSGPGSELAATELLRGQLISLIEKKSIKSIVDLPCGDFNWMRNVVEALKVDYVGLDIVPEIISKNTRCYANDRVRFSHADLTRDSLPNADLVISRDCFIHLSFADARKALENIKRSGFKYMLLSSYPNIERNKDILTGSWRPINLLLSPYNLPEPELRIAENEPGKEMWFWAIQDLVEKHGDR